MSEWSKNAERATSDVRNGVEAAKSSAVSTAQSVKDAASDAYSRSSGMLRDGAGRLADVGASTADTLASQIRSQPVTAAMACLGIGFLAGILLSRRVI